MVIISCRDSVEKFGKIYGNWYPMSKPAFYVVISFVFPSLNSNTFCPVYCLALYRHYPRDAGGRRYKSAFSIIISFQRS